jgi:hypothetical protein
MAADVDIANEALVLIGDQPILTIDDTSDRGKACKKLYPGMRDALLRAHPWRFSLKRVVLSKLVDVPAFGFAAQYQLPVDFLRQWDLIFDADNMPWTIEGGKVLTDSSTCKLLYASRVEDVGIFDTMFTRVLSRQLAAELAISIKGNQQLSQYLTQLAMSILGEAIATDSMEQTPRQLISDDLTVLR